MKTITLTVLLFFTTLAANATELPFCPIDYNECSPPVLSWVEQLERAHLYDSLVAPLRSYERDAIVAIMQGAVGKSPYDILEQDCGAHGAFHFRPPGGVLELLPQYNEIVTNAGDCPVENEAWVNAVEEVLYSAYGPALSLRKWREKFSPVVRIVRDEGWPRNRWAWALAMANSVGRTGFSAILESCPEDTIQNYLGLRPNSAHRQRRVERLRRM